MNIAKVNTARVKYLVDTLVKLLYIPVVANNMVALFDKFFSRHNHKIWLIEIPTRVSEDWFGYSSWLAFAAFSQLVVVETPFHIVPK